LVDFAGALYHTGAPPDPGGDHLGLEILGDPAGNLFAIGSVNILRWSLTRCSSSTMSPTTYTKINCYDREGSRGSLESRAATASSPRFVISRQFPAVPL
jgi:hypothetical protein